MTQFSIVNNFLKNISQCVTATSNWRKVKESNPQRLITVGDSFQDCLPPWALPSKNGGVWLESNGIAIASDLQSDRCPSTFFTLRKKYFVWMAGFEPATTRFQSGYSDQTELHPDKVLSTNWSEWEDSNPRELGPKPSGQPLSHTQILIWGDVPDSNRCNLDSQSRA